MSLGSFFFLILAVLGLSCSMHELGCVVWDLSLWRMDSLVVE